MSKVAWMILLSVLSLSPLLAQWETPAQYASTTTRRMGDRSNRTDRRTPQNQKKKTTDEENESIGTMKRNVMIGTIRGVDEKTGFFEFETAKGAIYRVFNDDLKNLSKLDLPGAWSYICQKTKDRQVTLWYTVSDMKDKMLPDGTAVTFVCKGVDIDPSNAKVLAAMQEEARRLEKVAQDEEAARLQAIEDEKAARIAEREAKEKEREAARQAKLDQKNPPVPEGKNSFMGVDFGLTETNVETLFSGANLKLVKTLGNANSSYYVQLYAGFPKLPQAHQSQMYFSAGKLTEIQIRARDTASATLYSTLLTSFQKDWKVTEVKKRTSSRDTAQRKSFEAQTRCCTATITWETFEGGSPEVKIHVISTGTTSGTGDGTIEL